MAPVTVPEDKLFEFADFDAFYAWLRDNHARADEVWIRIFKKSTGKKTITPVDAIDAVLCWGWIDAIKKSWDEDSFVQRYCPRRPRSVWSQVNRDNVARLSELGLMTEHGLVHVEAARKDGRWDAAYKTTQEAPADLLAAIARSPEAQKTYEGLSSQNRFALTFRTISMKTEAGRKKKIEGFVAMLERGETIYPQKVKS
ncbi:YdeI/OmpD-associated family protein [Devosia sediminis]|uniref:YdeI/OmpD-associated family protein n=1 Tax=Devosia sediminis TaxID=2798801 RepID=A0A934IZX8_9HYPH|nr:YdeI/OmpD-associated family protein [Devosia sediminis]MBJ3785773.1 YdeI/OmpD-associated family protein [Devosia sediminis]